MKKDVIIRILLGLFIFSIIIWGYWWLVLGFAIALLFYFSLYFEIILWGIIYDSIYGVSLPEFWNINYIFTIASIILFLISLLLKKRLIIYE